MQLRDNLNANLNVGYCSAGRSWLIFLKPKNKRKRPPPAKTPTTNPTQGANPGQWEDVVLRMVLAKGCAGVCGVGYWHPGSQGGPREPWNSAGGGYFMARACLLEEEFGIELGRVADAHHRDRGLWLWWLLLKHLRVKDGRFPCPP